MRILLAIGLAILSATLASADDDRIWLENTKIDGKAVKMIFDSGSSGAILTSQAVKRLGLKVVTPPTNGFGDTAVYSADFDGNPFQTDFSIVNIPYVAPGFDGLMGWGPFHSNIFRIDAEAQKLTFLSEAPAGVKHWTQLSIETNAGTLNLEISSKPGDQNIIFVDTGDPCGIVLKTHEWKRWKKAHPRKHVTLKAISTVDGIYVCEESWADQIQIGPFIFYDVPVMEENPSTAKQLGRERDVLGFAALRRLDLVVDGIHGVAYMRIKQTPPPPYSYNRLGAVFIPTAKDSNDLVAQVLTGTPAYEAGIRNGDILLKIDGQSVSGWTNGGTESDTYSMPAGTRLDLTLQRRRKIFETTATLRDILQPSHRKYNPTDDFPGKSELDAEGYFDQGLECERQGDSNGALTNYDKAIESDPDFGNAYGRRAYLEDTNEFDAAIADYEQALQLKVAFPKACLARIYIYRGFLEGQSNQLDAALADFKKSIEIEPDLAEAYAARGWLEQNTNEFDAAIADYEKAQQLKPGSTDIRFGLAQSYVDRGWFEDSTNEFGAAIADFEKALKLTPASADIKTNLAQIYVYRGYLEEQSNQLEAALADFNKGIELEPDSATAYADRGWLEQSTNEFDAAIADYEKALQLKPGLTDTKSSLAETRKDRGNQELWASQLDAALADFNKAIEVEPDLAEAYAYRGYVEQVTGKLDAALTDDDRAIQLGPGTAWLYGNRGGLEELKGDLDRSEADGAETARLDPQTATIAAQPFHVLGNSRYQRLEYTNALTDYRKDCELDPTDDYAHFGVWLNRSSLGNSEKATEDLKAWLSTRGPKDSGDWPSEVGRFLVGQITEQDLLGAANSADSKKDKDQHCEAYYYIGAKRLVAGDKTGAAAEFRKCLATDMKNFSEYQFAKADLQMLGAGN